MGTSSRYIRFTENLPEWPDIHSPLARRVVLAAYKMIPTGTTKGPVFDEGYRVKQETADYQKWLNDKLRRSGLAKGIAGGVAYLPDFYMHIPKPLKRFTNILVPRNLEQLTRHIAYNLEWYVDTSRQFNTPVTKAREMLPIVSIQTAMVVLILLISTTILNLHWAYICLITTSIFILTWMITSYFWDTSEKHRTHCAELYMYLVESFDESIEIDPAQKAEEPHIPYWVEIARENRQNYL